MPARVEIKNGTARIILSGDLDYSTQNDIHSAIDEGLQAEGILQIEVDLAEVSFMDSSVIRALLALQKEASRSGKSLAIVNSNDTLREIFIIGGFDKIFKLR
jgi:anti-sigma B factor antagonist